MKKTKGLFQSYSWINNTSFSESSSLLSGHYHSILMRRILRPLLFFFLAYTLVACSSMSKETIAPVSPVFSESKIESLLQDAELAYKAQRFPQAEQMFSLVLQHDAENQFALYRLGNLAFKQAKVDKAAQYYVSLLQINPAHSKSHYNLGICRLIQAREHLQNFVLMKDPASNTTSLENMIRQINAFASAQ